MALPLSLERPSTRVWKDAALLPVRATLAATMVHHGLAKVRAAEQTGQFFEQQLQLRPGKPLAMATGIAELVAGGAAILGFLTRPALLAVIVTQAVAIKTAHAKNGFDITKGGWEFNAALIAIAASLMVAGPGRYSTHEALEHGVQGRGAKGIWRRARPSLLVRLIKLLK